MLGAVKNYVIILLIIFPSLVHALSDDPATIVAEMDKKGTFTVVSNYKAFLSEIAQDLQGAPIGQSGKIQQRDAWLAKYNAYRNDIDRVFNAKSHAEISPKIDKSTVDKFKRQIADLLAQAEDYKVSAHKIIYDARVDDASRVEPNEVYRDLWPISMTNNRLIWNAAKTHVLAVSFMAKSSYERFWVPNIVNGELTLTDRNSWISPVPQLKNMLQEHARSNSRYSINDRARQILGVPPEKDSVERVYVELWVQPENLLRPCPDNEITDKECVPDYYHRGEDVFTKVPTDVQDIVVQTTGEKWKAWYLNERKDKYTSAWPFPWTRLGYTLDYRTSRDKKPIGASEYITKGGSKVIIKGAYGPEEYVKASN